MNIAIFLRPITFYIVSINLLFQLFLAHIDKLRTILNNMTNKVI